MRIHLQAVHQHGESFLTVQIAGHYREILQAEEDILKLMPPNQEEPTKVFNPGELDRLFQTGGQERK